MKKVLIITSRTGCGWIHGHGFLCSVTLRRMTERLGSFVRNMNEILAPNVQLRRHLKQDIKGSFCVFRHTHVKKTRARVFSLTVIVCEPNGKDSKTKTKHKTPKRSYPLLLKHLGGDYRRLFKS